MELELGWMVPSWIQESARMILRIFTLYLIGLVAGQLTGLMIYPRLSCWILQRITRSRGERYGCN